MNRLRPKLAPTLLTASVLASGLLLACTSGSDSGRTGDSAEPTGTVSSEYAVVTNGAFTNVYVYPDPDTESWDDHMKRLRPNDFTSFFHESIDAVTDRIMKPAWPSYFSSLYQYSGVNPPQYFGSSFVTQACINAAMADLNNGVMEWTTIRSLANCHVDGMDPSPQVNLIFSPDIKIAALPKDLSIEFPNAGELCSTSDDRAWHAWGLNTPNFTALPTSLGCVDEGDFDSFTRRLSHEIVELLSDPAGAGFGTFGSDEVADMCEKTDSETTLTVPPLVLARYWSNADEDCEPRLDSPSGSTSTTWVLGQGMSLDFSTNTSVVLPLPASRVVTSVPATRASIVFQTGNNWLKGAEVGENYIEVTLLYADGTTAVTGGVNMDGNQWNNGETNSALLEVDSQHPISSITGVKIATKLGTGYTWNVSGVALVLSYPLASPTTGAPPVVDSWLEASGAPLVRMTGDVHALPLPVTAVDPGQLQALNLVISTGNDDLRGGSGSGDNCNVQVQLTGGRTITLNNVNQGQDWGGWTKNTVSIPFPPGLQSTDVKSVTLTTGFGGGVGGDNWNVERVQLLATLLTPPPVVGQILPGVGRPAGGQSITIDGANFDTMGQTQFFFDGAPATGVACTSTTQCTVTSPPGSGAARVTATGRGGSSASSSEFDYAPSITDLSETTGSAGDTITVYGIGLLAGATLSFGPYPVQSATCTTNQCTVLVPGGAGAVDVSAVVNGYGTTPRPVDRFTYATPAVAAIDVTSGPISGYTTFNLDGSGFTGALWASTYSPPTILFGGVPALDVFCPYNNWCTGWTPPVSTPGPVQVTVKQFGQTSTGSVSFDYLLINDIQSFAVTQTTGTLQLLQAAPSGGAMVTITCSDPSLLAPMQVLVPQGSTSYVVQFPAWTKNENVVLTASYGGYSVNASLAAVIPPPPPPPPPPSGDAGTGTGLGGGIRGGGCGPKGKLCQ